MLGEEENYEYLEILEVDINKQAKTKETIRKKLTKDKRENFSNQELQEKPQQRDE